MGGDGLLHLHRLEHDDQVAGLDVVRDADAVRQRMGLTAQSATVDELLTGRENLEAVPQRAAADRVFEKLPIWITRSSPSKPASRGPGSSSKSA